MENTKIVAIIVTYSPCFEALDKLIAAIEPQVNDLVIVDNASELSGQLTQRYSDINSRVQISLKENMGIAFAHNKGIEWADENNADYIILLDQDSVPKSNMIELLASNLFNIHGKESVAIGPSYEDPRTHVRSYFIVSKFGFPYRYKPRKVIQRKRLVSVSFLISSGSLVSMNALRQHGGMRSEYFIDHVDTEWCFRLRNAGKYLIGEHDAVMEHSLGDEVRRVWFGYMRNVAYHSPLRDYYMFRNTLLMFKDVRLTLVWKIFLIGRLFQIAFYFLTFTPNRKERCRYMLKGILHGIKRISGRLDTKTFTCTDIPKTRFDPK